MTVLLDDLGRKYRTDKASTDHNYLIHYERLFAPFRDDEFDMLEIGVFRGASIRMWHDYFPRAHIVGLDTKPMQVKGNLPRFAFFQGSQDDPHVLQKLSEDYRFRLIIDDGSHLWAHQIATFENLFLSMASGGIYVCEDIQTSFGRYVRKFGAGANESAAMYFLRLAETLAAGNQLDQGDPKEKQLDHIVRRVSSVSFIRHCAIIHAISEVHVANQ